MPIKLFTSRQRLFIANYLIYKNATRAAKIAGYSAKTARSTGSRLLTNVDISEAIEMGLAEQLRKADVTSENVLNTLRQLAFAEKNNSGGLRALELFGKALGLFHKNRQKEEKSSVSMRNLLGPIQNGLRRS